MSSRTVLLLLFSLCAASAQAVDWGAFVASSDRGDDRLILEIMEGADFDTRVQMCEALGSRKDPYAEDILSWLMARFSPSTEHESEVLVRLTMKSFFDEAPNDQVLRERLQANPGFIDDLVGSVAKWQDPMLKDSIIRLLPHLGDMNRLPALMEVGTGIVETLQRTAGNISAAETRLAYDYLAIVQAIGTPDFLEPCLAIARLSRDKDLTLKARQVSGLLAGRAP